jgi:hypothetical protein
MSYNEWIKSAVAISQGYPLSIREIVTEISLYYLPKGETEKKEIRVKALWDTGSQCTLIHHSLEKTLNLDIIGNQSITGVDGIPSLERQYVVDISFHQDMIIPDVKVTSSGFGNGKFNMIIGMDIIGSGDFFIGSAKAKGSDNEFLMFSFAKPSACSPKDFVEEIMHQRRATPIVTKQTQAQKLQRKGQNRKKPKR